MDLIERLRAFEGSDELGNGDFSLLREAADALEAAREDAWQPIETAPRDGREIWVNDTSGLTSFCVAYWLSGDEWSGWVYDDDFLLDNNPPGPNPTHWRPIPAPPAIDHARGKGANDGS